MGWRIEVVPRDEAGKDLILTKYKPFRLLALRLDPSSFGSNLARELAFEDSVWTSRLMDPVNCVLVAMDDADEVVSAAFLRGPLPPDNANHLTSEGECPSDPADTPLLFSINGLWTQPAARRQGIGLALLGRAKDMAAEIGAAQERDCLVGVDAFEDNISAIAIYKKAGFAPCGRGQDDSVRLKMMLHTTAQQGNIPL